jgi:hypothetical protein
MVVPGVTRSIMPLTVILPLILVVLHSWASTRLCSLKVRFRTTLTAELKLQYWLITDSITMQQNTQARSGPSSYAQFR